MNSHPIGAAYFSMEIALEAGLPTYAGGLGILAGDTLRSAADMGLPMAGVTLLHRKGYFEQHLDARGNQSEAPSIWTPERVLQPLEARASIVVEGQTIAIRAWQYTVRGFNGHTVPVYLLDTALQENPPFMQTLTDHLYGGDEHYRLCQEVVLGIGGIAMLRQLGHHHVMTYHMNEGHAALLALALLEEHVAGRSPAESSAEETAFVRKKCVFTTHTPVPAGHDQFSNGLVRRVLGDERTATLERAGCLSGEVLNMTDLALRFSHYINGVAMQHGEVSRGMFPEYSIRAITNGVHAGTWASLPFQELYDRHIPEWRRDNLYFRYAIGIPLKEIHDAHAEAKSALIAEVARATGVQLDANVLTLGFARRATAYKRADLLFSDLERLRSIARNVGPLQIIYGGKAHPQDETGKEQIRHVVTAMTALKDIIPSVYVENYDMRWASLITSGVDLWLNTPERPHEASGTSGMKAALNGVPSFSVPDGWWLEGHVEGATGWDIGRDEIPETEAVEIAALYHKLEKIIVPLFYGRPDAYAEVMRLSIALNGSFFNTQRMLAQYVLDAYFEGKSAMPAEHAVANSRHSDAA
ncbi:MAG: alpha-glucan family phosphorylase [Acidobacteriia bacterium]|nr:alpha-glucan family phosphorylase [Terriglobia bacterium]